MASNSNVSRGIGHGEAQVYSSSSPINTYAKLLAQQKLQREKEVNDIQSYLGTAKMDGLREADRDDYFKMYDKWRDKATMAYKASNGLERATLKADADKELAQLNKLVADSKQVARDYHDFQGKLIDDRIRDQFSDDAVSKVQQSAKLPLSNPNFIKDFTTLERQVDTSKILGEFDKIDDQLLQSNAKYDNPRMREIKNGDKVGTEYLYTKRVDPAIQALNYGVKYDTDKATKVFIQKQYAPLFDTLPEEEAKAQAIQDLVSKRSLIREDAPKIDWQPKPDNWKEKMDYAEGLRRSRPDRGDGDGGGGNNFTVTEKTFYRPAFQATNGTEVPETPIAKFDRYVAVNPVSFGTSQLSSGYNISTGKNERVAGNASLELTGIGYTTVKGGKKQMKASVVDSDGQEWLFNVSDIPLKTREDKYVNSAIRAVGTPPKNVVKPKPTKETVTVKETTKPKSTKKEVNEADIPSFAKRAGYTVKEYKELLKRIGVKVIK